MKRWKHKKQTQMRQMEQNRQTAENWKDTD